MSKRNDMEKTIEISEGYEARIEGNKVILEQNDESIRNFLYEFIKICGWSEKNLPPRERCLAYLERQKSVDAVRNLPKEGESDGELYQPHWKPSEDQMEALMLAIEGKWAEILPTGYMSRRLEDLYEGLANTFNVKCKLEK